MKTYWMIGLRLTLITMFLFGVIYPLAITGVAKLIAPNGGAGKTVEAEGKIVGFELIGQSFESTKYFHGRPSAVSYNAAATGGSNKGPTNPDYLQQVEERIDILLKENPDVKREDIPVDLVTASGGGLDPHISLQAALIQVPRVAKQRGIDLADLKVLVLESTEEPLWNLFGPQKVNVLKLNIALDKLKQSTLKKTLK